MLTKEQFLAAKPRLKRVEVLEWDITVWIRPITLAEQGRIADLADENAKKSTQEKLKNGTATLILWTACNEDGTPFFVVADMPFLMDKPASGFLRLQDEIMSWSGLTKESREELEKNLLKAETSTTVM